MDYDNKDNRAEPSYGHPDPPPPYDGPSANPTSSVSTIPAPVVIVQPTSTSTIVIRQLGIEPTMMVCPSCHHQILSRVTYIPTFRTHCCALCLFAVGCWLCMCLPYCSTACTDAEHYCPSCNSYLGRYSK